MVVGVDSSSDEQESSVIFWFWLSITGEIRPGVRCRIQGGEEEEEV